MSEQLEMIQQEWQLYKQSNPKTPQLVNSILQKARENPSDLWTVCFEADPIMWQSLRLVETEVLAKKSKNLYLKEMNITLLEMISETAHADIQYQDDIHPYGSTDSERINVWKEIFKDVPEFELILTNTIAYWENWRTEKLGEYSLNNESQTVLETVTFLVPYLFTTSDNEPCTIIPTQLIEQLKSHYNQFRLDTYMDLPFKTNGTSLEGGANGWEFSFYISSTIENRLEALTTLQDELKGQLIDGWGESFEQKGLLVDTTTIYPGFDVDNMKIISNTPKLKM